MAKSDHKSSRLKLGAIMIVKNEEKNLGNILGDIKDLMDEIVVVDTGSTDSTEEIARSCGVTLGSFAWCDDFSAARNASIELAKSDYLIWFDADDRIDKGAAKGLRQLMSSLDQSQKTAYFLKVFNTAEDHSHTISYQLRVFPNLGAVRFAGRLHEQVMPSLSTVPGMKFERRDITIRHMGYHSESQVEEKGRRNLSIQHKELEEGNDSATHYFFMAMSCHAIKDYVKCLDYIAQARLRSTNENWYKYSFNLSTECLLKLKRYEDSANEARNGTRLYPESGTMHYNLGAVCLKAGHFDEAISALMKAKSLGVDMDDFPTPPNIAATLHEYLGTAFEKTGKKAEAIEAYRESIRSNPAWVPSLKMLGMVLVSAGEVDEAVIYLEKAYSLGRKNDLQLTLSLGRILRFKAREADAHKVYVDALAIYPDHPHILSGLVLTSAVVDDMDCLVKALESLMRLNGMDTNRQIQDFPELAGLCAIVGRALLEKGEPDCAAALADTATMIDHGCWEAHLLSADVSMNSDRNLALTCLQNALKAGAPAGELEQRMAQLENRW